MSNPFLAGDVVLSKVVKDVKKNIMVVIGYTKSEFYDPNNRETQNQFSKKGQYRDALSLSLLRIYKEKNQIKYDYPDKFVIDHPNFCKCLHVLKINKIQVN
jgi:hypothetical protein